MYDLIIRDATIISSSGRLVADIGVEDGKIAYIGSNPAGSAKEETQGIGRFVMPGVIDSSVFSFARRSLGIGLAEWLSCGGFCGRDNSVTHARWPDCDFWEQRY